MCFNNRGSCYGSTGPKDPTFPRLAEDPKRGAPLTTWDQARFLLLALDRLGVGRVDLAIGGSVGDAVVLCLAALDPERFVRIAPAEASSSLVLGFNRVARELILSATSSRENQGRALSLARQLAHLTYRAEAGLSLRHGRALASDIGAKERARFLARTPYRLQRYQGCCRCWNRKVGSPPSPGLDLNPFRLPGVLPALSGISEPFWRCSIYWRSGIFHGSWSWLSSLPSLRGFMPNSRAICT